jgi:hypothetical protein
MAELELAAVEAGERDRAIGTLVSAFAFDPVERWLYPEEGAYRRWFPAFVRAFGGDAFATKRSGGSGTSRRPAYLETPNPRTVRFYERAGFGTTGVARAGACAPITPMGRPAGGTSPTGSGVRG